MLQLLIDIANNMSELAAIRVDYFVGRLFFSQVVTRFARFTIRWIIIKLSQIRF